MKIAGKILATAAMCGLVASNVQADPIFVKDVKDPVASLDWSIGNALAVGLNLKDNKVANNQVGSAYTMYYQAVLGNFIGTDSLPIVGTGLNQYTVVAGFGEKTDTLSHSNSSTTSTFTFDPNNPTNYFNIYYSQVPNINTLAGTGFITDKLVMSGYFTDAFGTFSVKNTAGVPQTSALVSATEAGASSQAAADWNGVKTVKGSGGDDATVKVTYCNPIYFSSAPGTLVMNLNYNGNFFLPFTGIAPAEQFVTPGGTTIGTKPLVGSVNGSSGDAFLFQADGNSALDPLPVPEPSNILCIGAGLLSLSMWARRHKFLPQRG